MAGTFSPERLRLARQRRGLLGQELAALVGVTAKTVSSWEHAKKHPSDANISSIAKALNYPQEHFYLQSPPTLAGPVFRSLARMTAKQGAKAQAAGIQAVELDGWISKRYKRPEPTLPDLRDVEPEQAAGMLRAEWGLGSKPLPNLVHLMEKNGVRVYSLVHDGVEVDAFSAWVENTPFVFLNTTKTAERSRMDAAHELGHLVLHRFTTGKAKKHEEEAQVFASAFLMPRNAFMASAPSRPTLPEIFQRKRDWGVSALAYVYRMNALNLIPYWAYTNLCIRLRMDYGNAEPGPTIDREMSQVLAKVIGSKDTGASSRREIADDLCIRLGDLDDMTFGLTLTPVQGGSSRQATPATGQQRKELRLVR